MAAVPEERMIQAARPARGPQKPVEDIIATSRAANRMIEKASQIGLGDESNSALLFDLYINQKVDYDGYKELFNQYAKTGPAVFGGIAAGTAGAPADIMAMAVALGYNFLNMAQGGEFTWPEEWESIPGTTDFLGDLMGLDPNDYAFMMGSFIGLDPTKTVKQGIVLTEGAIFQNLRPTKKFINKALRAAKVLQGTPNQRIARLEEAKKLLDEGVDRVSVWKQTGWFPDARGRLRFFLSDSDASMKWDNLYNLAQEQFPNAKLHEIITVRGRTDEVVSHPALFEIFPTMGGHKVSVKMQVAKDGNGKYFYRPIGNTGTTRGSFNPVTKDIQISTSNPLLSVIHELNHKADNLAGIGSGASVEVFSEQLFNFKEARALYNIARDPEKVKGLTTKQWKQVFRDITSKERLDKLVREAIWITNMDDFQLDLFKQDQLIELRALAEDNARWLNEIQFQHGDKGIEQAMLELTPDGVKELAYSRYLVDQEEVSARISQALRHLDQELIDDLPTDPYDLQSILTPDVAKDLAEEGFTNIEPMAHPRPLDKIRPREASDDVTNAILSEKDLYFTPIWGKDRKKIHLKYLHSPTKKEIMRFAKENQSEKLRYIVAEDDVYIWPASAGLHEDVGTSLGLDMFNTGDGGPYIYAKDQGTVQELLKELDGILW